MKKWIVFFMILFLFQIKAYADPVILEENNMTPDKNSSMDIISTNSQIHIKNKKCYIENDFIFKNFKKEKMTMGILYDGVYDVKISSEEKEISTFIHKGQKNQKWYIWEIPTTKEQVNVKISYCKENIIDPLGGENIRYSLPQNHIHYGKVTFIFDEGLDPQDIKVKGYEKYEKKEQVNIEMNPKENEMVWTIYDHMNPFNIELYYRDYRKIEKEKLLDQEKRTQKEIKEIKELGKKAYDSYINGEYEKSIEYINDMDLYKKNKNKEVSEYALKMTNFLDYYRGCIYQTKGNTKDAIYYFKSSGILYNRNLYDLINLYHNTGSLDEYTKLLKEIMEKEERQSGIRIWAEQEIDHLPNGLKEQYGIEKKYEIKEEKNIKKDEQKFSFKGFWFFHMGITVLFLVVFWNIKKR
ncbi:tetratricopeptide repeat protein [Inediibacterium massiliense]|uniref:tetratricopeptide repeat protein n=1 Tax=Inediibacterium massiliense TaxID=1658111 RepID=UPI0006B51D94|nr:hypothetical protein [Inediibacterium massiliense]